MTDSDGEKNRKIFVGGLDSRTTSDDLKEYFSQWGEIIDSIVMTESATKRSRGFGFVTFEHPSSVDDCLRDKPHRVSGKEVEAKRAVPREETTPFTLQRTKKVFLGGLAPETTAEEITEVLAPFGGLLEVKIMTEQYTEKPRGFGFAMFDDYDSVDKVCNKKFHRIGDRDVEAKKAVSQEEMRRSDNKHRPSGGHGGDSYSGRSAPYGASRGSPYGGRGGGGYSDYARGGGGAHDYQRYQSAGAPDYGYSRMVNDYYAGMRAFDQGTVPSGYGPSAYPFSRFTGGGYSEYSMYGQNAGPMGTYNQSASAYGPSRGYSGGSGGGSSDVPKDRDRGMSGGSRSQYHPYKRY